MAKRFWFKPQTHDLYAGVDKKYWQFVMTGKRSEFNEEVVRIIAMGLEPIMIPTGEKPRGNQQYQSTQQPRPYQAPLVEDIDF